jgi:hypothetical protein
MKVGDRSKGKMKSREYDPNLHVMVDRNGDDHRALLMGKLLAEIKDYDVDQLDALLTIAQLKDGKEQLMELRNKLMRE